MHLDLKTPISAAGILSIIASLGTIVSSLCTPKVLRILGTGKLVAYSIALTAMASVGYGLADSFNILCHCAIPMGIGAGAVDVAMNNFAAIYLESKHTNWLHASWGIGATLGPSLLSFSILTGGGWRGAYEYVAIALAAIFVLILISLPLWKRTEARGGLSENVTIPASSGSTVPGNAKVANPENAPRTAAPDSNNAPHISIREALRVPGMKLSFLTFFFYSALEISTSLWCGTYLIACGFKPEIGAFIVSLMFASVMIGRIASGFFAIKFTDHRLIYAGIFIVSVGCLILSIPARTRLRSRLSFADSRDPRTFWGIAFKSSHQHPASRFLHRFHPDAARVRSRCSQIHRSSLADFALDFCRIVTFMRVPIRLRNAQKIEQVLCPRTRY